MSRRDMEFSSGQMERSKQLSSFYRYDGEWLHGKQHGDALFTDVKGKAKHCVWKNGEFEKWK